MPLHEAQGATPVELSVTTTRQDDVSVVTVAGEVDVYTAAQLRAVLDEEIGAGHARLVVDLDQVSFLDSTGLGVLVGRLKLVRNHSGWLRIVCSNDRILRVFRITGLDKVFGIHDSLEEALAA
jgi:anti-sigma B factor antagonist